MPAAGRDARAPPSASQRKKSDGQATPVLMLTAYHAATEQLLGEMRGAVEVLDKPFELDDLVTTVRAMAVGGGR